MTWYDNWDTQNIAIGYPYQISIEDKFLNNHVFDISEHSSQTMDHDWSWVFVLINTLMEAGGQKMRSRFKFPPLALCNLQLLLLPWNQPLLPAIAGPTFLKTKSRVSSCKWLNYNIYWIPKFSGIFLCVKVRVLIGKKWNPVNWNKDIWVDPAKLKTLNS